MGYRFHHGLVAVGVEVTGEDDLDPVAPAPGVVGELAGTGDADVARVTVMLDYVFGILFRSEHGGDVLHPLFAGVLKD